MTEFIDKDWYRFVAKFLINEYFGLLKKYGHHLCSSPISIDILRIMLKLNYMGYISRKQLKDMLNKWFVMAAQND